jgi:hypothetical protein
MTPPFQGDLICPGTVTVVVDYNDRVGFRRSAQAVCWPIRYRSSAMASGSERHYD